MGKVLLLFGVLIATTGLLVVAGVPVGRLPGDMVFRRDGFTAYIPITTSILLSLGLTVVLMLIRR